MEKNELLCTVGKNATIMENIMNVPQKIKNRTIIWPSSSPSEHLFH